MNDFDDRNLYELTDAESKDNWATMLSVSLYLVLAAVVLITGAHAVMLVLSQTESYRFATMSPMLASIFTAIRVAFPLMVEAAAVVAGVGFIGSRWRKRQKTVGTAIEITWLIFAALNMITFFAVERGQALEGWQVLWIQYGLPASALIAGVLTYLLLRFDPDHKRSAEQAAAQEKIAARKFWFRKSAMMSPAMMNIERQRAFMDVVDGLRQKGYSEQQIRYMISHTPELMFDDDENGTPDVLEAGQGERPNPAAALAAAWGRLRAHPDGRSANETVNAPSANGVNPGNG